MWQPSSFSLPLFVAAITATILAVFLWQRREATGAKALAFTTLAAGFWAFAYGFELLSSELSSVLIWAKISYLGITTLPVGWFLFCLSFSGILKKFRITNLTLFVLPLITIALVFSNEQHELIWSNIRLGPYQTFETDYGFWFWLNICYTYALLAAGTSTLLFRLFRTPAKYQGQLGSLLVGLLLPMVGNITYLTGAFRVVDLSPFAFILSILTLVWGMFRHKLFDLVPVARSLAVEQMNEGVIVLDHRQRLLDINSAAANMLDENQASVIGVHIKDVSKEVAVTALNSGQPQRLKLKDRVIELKSSPLKRGDHTRGQILVLFDITEQAEIEETLRQAKEAAELAKSVQNNFLANMRHELNTPLTAIIGFNELLYEEVAGPLNDMQKQYLGDVLEQSHRLKEMIQRVLEYARLEANAAKLESSYFDLKTFLEITVMNIIKDFSRKGNNFKMEIESNLGKIKSDQNKLQKIIYHLLDNANKFTKNGEITLSAKRLEQEFVISVTDTGIGVAQEHLEHIFTSFMQLDNTQTRSYGGNGLGLALCRRYTKILNGDIVVESKLGEGSTFSLHLPLEAEWEMARVA